MSLTPNCLRLTVHHFAIGTVEPGLHRPSKEIAVILHFMVHVPFDFFLKSACVGKESSCKQDPEHKEAAQQKLWGGRRVRVVRRKRIQQYRQVITPPNACVHYRHRRLGT